MIRTGAEFNLAQLSLTIAGQNGTQAAFCSIPACTLQALFLL
jgi:hypothetical protein